jgi:hypothetical protein
MENKTGKYFKYAIGEIVLVMIGILLALQVSNWNQDRKDRISERKLLDNIHRDFIQNKISFDSIKVINYRGLNALEKMIDLFPLKRDTLKHATFMNYNAQIQSITYNPYNSSVESAVNSSSLQLIQDEDLQKYLVSWKDVLLDYQEDEKAYFEYLKNFLWPHFRKEFDSTGKDTEMNMEARTTIKYQNMIIGRRNHLRGVIKAIEGEPIENHINEIIRLTAPKDQ